MGGQYVIQMVLTSLEGVLVTSDSRSFQLQYLLSLFGKKDADIRRIFSAAFSGEKPEESALALLDNGTWDLKGLHTVLKEQGGLQLPYDSFVASYLQGIGLMESVVELYQQLAVPIVFVAGGDYSVVHAAYMLQARGLMPYAQFFSCEYACHPDNLFGSYVLPWLQGQGVAPGKCLYVTRATRPAVPAPEGIEQVELSPRNCQPARFLRKHFQDYGILKPKI